tara:strand:+ start:1376 stop:1633 length:258 start_codon:yes stop_codon:yes gene_type:complete
MKKIQVELIDIKCADCKKVILHMFKVKDSEDIFHLTVSCPFCEGESWNTKLKGKHHQQTVEGTKMHDFITVDNKNILIKVIKDAR